MNHKSLPGIVLDDKDTWNDQDDFAVTVEAGRKGLNAGIPNGMGRVNDYLYGIHRGRYYLIGADSGVGKTTLGDYMFLHTWWNCKQQGIPFYGKYLSFEISKREKTARWVSLFIKLLYDRDVPSDYILGRIPNLIVSDDDLEMIKTAKRVVDAVKKDVEIVEGSVHPTWILNWMIEGHYEKVGKVIRIASKDPKKKGYITGYKPNDPRAVTMLVCDHVALAHEEKGLVGTKAVIDKLSNYAVQIRNLFNTTILFLQQFNTDLTSTHRMHKKSEGVLAPQRIDFGDSKYTFRDADVVFGLVSPVQFDVERYKGYDITQLYNYFLALHLMKNRYGTASRILPLFMNPISGVFEDLPLEPNNLIAMQPYYDKAQKLEQLCQLYSPRDQQGRQG